MGRKAAAFDIHLGRVNLAWVDGANASNFPLFRQL
jgi:prepilin-type processing-associated H-X9-DG protein